MAFAPIQSSSIKQSRMLSFTFFVASTLIAISLLPLVEAADYPACDLSNSACVNSPHASGRWCCPSTATSLTVDSKGFGTCQGLGVCGASMSSDSVTEALYRPCAGQQCKTSYPQFTSPGSSPVCCTDAPLVWLSGGQTSSKDIVAGCRTPQTCASPPTWSPWTCSTSCGYGTETRTCSSGGISCVGDSYRPCFSRTSCPSIAAVSHWSLASFQNPYCSNSAVIVTDNGTNPCTSIGIPQHSLSVICINTEDVQFSVTSSTDCSPVGVGGIGGSSSSTWTAKAGSCTSRIIQGVSVSFIARCASNSTSADKLLRGDILLQTPSQNFNDGVSGDNANSSTHIPSKITIFFICVICLVFIVTVILLWFCFCHGLSSLKVHRIQNGVPGVAATEEDGGACSVTITAIETEDSCSMTDVVLPNYAADDNEIQV